MWYRSTVRAKFERDGFRVGRRPELFNELRLSVLGLPKLTQPVGFFGVNCTFIVQSGLELNPGREPRIHYSVECNFIKKALLLFLSAN